MKDIILSLPDDLASRLSDLSEDEKRQVNKLIEDTLYPTGGDQTVMAITLLEKGFKIPLIAKLTRLDESFLEDLNAGVKLPRA
ncbi:hypothetical protein [uncultured Imperialibacter sp.]|jgi:hypothetical protein|uniref:hypothetical protein n=1 Tax=Imperialibacter sp. TaxID=2038411 RepID=UPI0030DB5CC0|tara:strand:- start:63881 stop:64129 length:249 start_codon:yes stop_codon:yes gene_type:complete